MTVKRDNGGMDKAIIMSAFGIRLKITRSAEVIIIQLTARIISDEEHGPVVIKRPAPTPVHNETWPSTHLLRQRVKKHRSNCGARASKSMKGEVMANQNRKKVSRAKTQTGRARALKPSAAPQRPAWWLAADIEVCVFCHQGYAHGTGYRCSECDAAVCMFCIEQRSKEFFCPEC